MQVVSGGFGLVGPVLLLLFWALVAFALYWVVRLGVRHGLLDAGRRAGPPAVEGRTDHGGPLTGG